MQMAVRLRILIVDDEWLIAEDLAYALRRAGHDVVACVPSVREALVIADREKIDFALLDVQLNNETSYAIADSLTGKGVPFAFLTGYAEGSLPLRFSGVKMLQKPVGNHLLLNILPAVGEAGAPGL
jgi:DNA-binding response OmpR family regulator